MQKLDKRLYITIDTEPDCDTKWRRSNPLTFTSVIEGIPNLLRPLWNQCKAQIIYFVSPEVLENEAASAILRQEIKYGAIIGAHLHSEYIEPLMKYPNAAGTTSNDFPCFAVDKEIEKQKIKNLRDKIREKLSFDPIWYRAARFGADMDTIHILKELGFHYDSSCTPFIDWTKYGGPNHSKSPVQPYYISDHDLYIEKTKPEDNSIIEVPITIYGKRSKILNKLSNDSWLSYNWLRPTHMFLFEMKELVKKIEKNYPNPVFAMMFHSMEIIPGKTPFVRNKFMQKSFMNRLTEIIKYIER